MAKKNQGKSSGGRPRTNLVSSSHFYLPGFSTPPTTMWLLRNVSPLASKNNF